MSELRWHPFLQEWVITATHRQNRTFLPPDEYCPLCPTRPGGVQTEVPAANYDIVVFENKFPSLRPTPPEPAVASSELFPVEPAYGHCEVILYSPNHFSTLAGESLQQINKLIYVWRDRYLALGSDPKIKYVFIFENKGEIVGVTLHHPHGQIYAFPFLPPKIKKEIASEKAHYRKFKRCLMCDCIKREISDGRRIVADNEDFLAFIPFFARYPYELYITSINHRSSLAELNNQEIFSLAKIMKTVLLKYDKLFGYSLPYIMVMHQKPTDGKSYPGSHFHIEFYPPMRTAKKAKYLAGCEAGAGTFINDTLAEEKAAELRRIEVDIGI